MTRPENPCREQHSFYCPAGRWDLIGSHVDGRETSEAASIREPQEEVGQIPTVSRNVGIFNDEETGAKYHL